MHSKPYKEGRSPFIFKADKEEAAVSQDNGDDDDDQMDSLSDLSIRESLSRSCSLASLDELRVLAAAMDHEETQLEVPEVPNDSQEVLAEPPPGQGTPVLEDVVNTPSPPKEQSFGESAIDKKQQREQLSFLLNMVKQKYSTMTSEPPLLPLNTYFFHQSSVCRFFLFG